jgi:hypothetical protein
LYFVQIKINKKVKCKSKGLKKDFVVGVCKKNFLRCLQFDSRSS